MPVITEKTAVVQIQPGATDAELDNELPHLEVLQDPEEDFGFDPYRLLNNIKTIWGGKHAVGENFNVRIVPWWSGGADGWDFTCTFQKRDAAQNTPDWMPEELRGQELYVNQTVVCHPVTYDQQMTYLFQIGTVDADPHVGLSLGFGSYLYASRPVHPMEDD